MLRVVALSLLSCFAFTAAAATGKPAADASAPTSTRPISTGVTAPRLVYSTKITIGTDELRSASANRVILRFKLDATGTPQNIRVVQPLTQTIDSRVLAAVRQFRWTPAVLNNQPVPIDMNLAVDVTR